MKDGHKYVRIHVWGFLSWSKLNLFAKQKYPTWPPCNMRRDNAKIFAKQKFLSPSIHWSWHLTQTSMSIIYQNHLVIYFSRLLGFRHASATFCSGNFIGINMHDFFCLRKQHKIFFSLLDNYYVLCYNDQLHILVLIYH